ncbi:MAG TPA: enoyl-CoA hydratase-related protein [Casimicrobiaceae bacterium]
MSDHDGFTIERDADRGTATVTLDVAGKFNRVSMPARDELRAAFEELDRDDAIRFVVLTGAGGAFTAGGDIPGFLERSAWHVSRLADNVAAPERCTKPVVAALRGYTFGVGLELALACDFRIAADDVQLGFPEVTIGMIPGSGGTQRLARLVGLGRAMELVTLGEAIDANEAWRIGLVNRVCAAEELMPTALAICRRWQAKGPVSLMLARDAVLRSADADLASGLDYENKLFALAIASGERDEGVKAFREKRPARFRMKG